ncbi:MAG: ATP-dependent RNA helicase HrpA [Deltaproteobacteria bacterium HGW-Deltaproteobacteria-10]|nr:MAG: ATP-dependent RNA helicase HrpA [Deltaproteobacteria bacterium HGW-Deltaproteobacteria-10]
MPSIKQHIYQINKDINQAMAADYYTISRAMEEIKRNINIDNPAVSLKKLLSLQKKVQYSRQRFQLRTGSVPHFRFPKDLPISGKKNEIIAAIQKNQVVIITGETGSGKTTQIPKMCLAAGCGLRGMIGLTQPRRIAATSIAARIAAEIGEPCGKSVAYKIRFEEKTSAEPLIKVMTDGILLAETVSDQLLLAYDTIIVDEAHERSLNIDFILGFLRTLLVRRKDLKLIITSATIDTAKFSGAFSNAPIIEVSGRMFPVDVRYSPVDPVAEENGEATYVDEAIACVEKLQMERRYDDILIFLPTEQDIREACERLSKRCSGMVLPLYARLSGSQQRLVFEKIDQQKIIVATNIAETSLTIPGIKYVIDSGLARQLEYNPRSQTTGLPIKPISRSSAEQRKGRCGRVQNGICIRLYSADDYDERQLYTAPEIMRSNLAGVILRMLSLKLGSVHSFPFIDAPHPKSIRDGLDILDDLGAIEKSSGSNEPSAYRLTAIGIKMAQLPLDPRISRILIAAQEEGCINEVAIIAAALSIPDPRERPYDKTDQAARAHALFSHPESDFLTYLNIWNHYHDIWEKLQTQNKLRKFCHEHFLSYKRMIEWRDIYQQIISIIAGDKTPPKTKKHVQIEIDQILYDKIHKCILSGYLSHIALKKEKNFFTAAKSREVMIYPGSGLFNRAASWIVAAEITQTSRLFARNVANIKSEWLEEVGRDNCRYSYAAAHWEKNRGQVVALEKVTLYGLTIVEKRTVAYERINPAQAKAIFIREALVTGEVNRKIPFLEHNLALWQNALTIEDKLRKRGFAADEEAIAQLYEKRLPDISDIRTLLKLIRDKGSDEFLRFREEDFIAVAPDEDEIAKYPDKINIADAAFPCHYSFAPGRNNDGVTMKIPLGLISKAADENVERFLPSLLQEKILHLLKSLPKGIRHKLPAAAQIAGQFTSAIPDSKKPLPHALSRFIQDKYRITIPLDAWNLEKLPAHLNVLYSVINEKGEEVKVSRDLGQLQEELADTVNLGALDKIRPQWEKEDITNWDFGELPEKIPLTNQHGLVGFAYPALQSTDEAINLRLFSDQQESESNHIQGIAALYSLHFADKLKQLKKNIVLAGNWKLMAAKIGNPKLLEQSLLQRVKNDLFGRPWRTQNEFFNHAKIVDAQILQAGQQLLSAIEPVLKSFSDTQALLQKLAAKNTCNNPQLAFLKDTQAELQRLVLLNFPELYSFERMKELPRYMKALALRAERGSLNLAAAGKKIESIEKYSQQLQQIISSATSGVIPAQAACPAGNPGACLGHAGVIQELDFSEEKKNALEELFWMIEEYKVSLFAQELKTPYPVSPKKLDQLIKTIEEL